MINLVSVDSEMRMKVLLLIAFAFVSVVINVRSEHELFYQNDAASMAAKPLLVPLTLIPEAASKGAGISLSLSLSE